MYSFSTNLAGLCVQSEFSRLSEHMSNEDAWTPTPICAHCKLMRRTFVNSLCFHAQAGRTRFCVAAHFSDPLVLSFSTVFLATTETKPGKVDQSLRFSSERNECKCCFSEC